MLAANALVSLRICTDSLELSLLENAIYRGYYMSATALLNLLNELMKSDSVTSLPLV